jgi:LysR family transcriptional regulator, regulator of abg operon
MIELRKIRHIVAVAQHRGFARAAEALHITQSALTKSVQAVETQLGITLFERGPRGVRLTADGEWFIERAGRVLAELQELEASGQAARELRQGQLRIGAAPAALDILLRDPLAQFARRFPGVRIQVEANSVEQIGVLLMRGEIDLAVGALDSLKAEKGLEVQELYTAPVAMFVRRGHPLDAARVPSLEELFHYPMIGPTPPEPHHTVFRRMAIELRSPYRQPQIIVGSFSVTQRLIEQTDGFSFVFEQHADTEAFRTRFRSWRNRLPIPPLAIEIAWRSGWQSGRAAQEFIDTMRAVRERRPTGASRSRT